MSLLITNIILLNHKGPKFVLFLALSWLAQSSVSSFVKVNSVIIYGTPAPRRALLKVLGTGKVSQTDEDAHM